MILLVGGMLTALWGHRAWRRYTPRRQRAGSLYEAEARLDAALADARARFERLGDLARVAPSGEAHAEATATLGQARHLLAARVDALERARFDLRLVWWKNRIDAALDDEASGQATAHDTLEHLTTLRAEAETVVATLGPDTEDVYADLRPLLRDGVAALTALTARLFDESVAEAVAGVAAPLDTLSPARASVQAALAELSAVVEAAPAVARADALTRETLRLDLETDDYADETAMPLARIRTS